MIEFGLILSGKKDIYERRSATLLGWLSDIGGLNDAFKLILSPLIGVISSIAYSLSLTNDQPVTSSNHKSQELSQQSKRLLRRIEEQDQLKLDRGDVSHLLNPVR